MNTFSLLVGVYDNGGQHVETSLGSYTISLTLSSSGIFSGTVSGVTTNGQITFSGLRIISRGTYTITASSTGITSATTSTVSIVNYAYTVTTATSNSSPSENFSFTITVTIKGEDGAAFLGSCTVALTESTSSITMTSAASALTTSTGTATLSIYATSTGSKTITATCPASGSSPAVSGSVAITVLTEVLKITFTPTVIFM